MVVVEPPPFLFLHPRRPTALPRSFCNCLLYPHTTALPILAVMTHAYLYSRRPPTWNAPACAYGWRGIVGRCVAALTPHTLPCSPSTPIAIRTVTGGRTSTAPHSLRRAFAVTQCHSVSSDLYVVVPISNYAALSDEQPDRATTAVGWTWRRHALEENRAPRLRCRVAFPSVTVVLLPMERASRCLAEPYAHSGLLPDNLSLPCSSTPPRCHAQPTPVRATWPNQYTDHHATVRCQAFACRPHQPVPACHLPAPNSPPFYLAMMLIFSGYIVFCGNRHASSRL